MLDVIVRGVVLFFFKQTTAYDLRISDWSSDVCSSDLLMLVCSSVSPLSRGGIDRDAADFHELGERAARRGLRVGYEALAWGRHVNDHRDAWEIVRRAEHPSIGPIRSAERRVGQVGVRTGRSRWSHYH